MVAASLFVGASTNDFMSMVLRVESAASRGAFDALAPGFSLIDAVDPEIRRIFLGGGVGRPGEVPAMVLVLGPASATDVACAPPPAQQRRHLVLRGRIR